MGLFDWVTGTVTIKDGETGASSINFESPIGVTKQMPLWSEGELVEMSDEDIVAAYANLNASFARAVYDASPVLKELGRRGMSPPETSVLFSSVTRLSNMRKADEPVKDLSELDDPPADEPEHTFVHGPEDAVVAFIGASVSPTDVIKSAAFTGPQGATLRDLYLTPLGVDRSDCLLGTIVPVLLKDDRDKPREPTTEEIAEWVDKFWEGVDTKRPHTIVALGKKARDALGEQADLWLPHPLAVRMMGDTGEVGRKMVRLRSLLSKKVAERLDSEYEPRRKSTADDSDDIKFLIVKSDDEKQLITGVVLEPDSVDSQGDVMSAEEIEKAAHFYMLNSRVVGDEHQDIADDVSVVESYIAPDDLGFDQGAVKKGTWVMTVHVESTDRWQAVKKGDYSGFSVGGFGTRVDPQ